MCFYLLNLCKVKVIAPNKRKAPNWCKIPSNKGTDISKVKTPNIN